MYRRLYQPLRFQSPKTGLISSHEETGVVGVPFGKRFNPLKRVLSLLTVQALLFVVFCYFSFNPIKRVLSLLTPEWEFVFVIVALLFQSPKTGLISSHKTDKPSIISMTESFNPLKRVLSLLTIEAFESALNKDWNVLIP